MLGFSPLAGAPLASTGDAENPNASVFVAGVSTPGAGVGSVTTSEGQGSLVVFSGWGIGAWNSSSGAWGQTNNLPNAISGNVGSPTISIGVSTSVSGIQALGQVGTAASAVNVSVVVTGLSVSGGVNGVVTTGAATVSLEGVESSGDVSPVSPTILVQVTGLSSQCLPGSVFVWGRIVPENLANWVEIEPVAVDSWTQISAQSSAAFQPLVPNAGTGYTKIEPASDTGWEKVAA